MEERYEEDAPDVKELLDDVTSNAKGYIEAQKKIVTLEVGTRIGTGLSYALLSFLSMLIMVIVAALLAVALSLYLGSLLGSNALGFLAGAGIFLLLLGIFFLLWRTVLRDRITLAIINAMHGQS